MKLPISIGILAWNSGQTLVDTLKTYYENGLLDIATDVTILFQEISQQDYEIANHFKLNFIGMQENIGIGNAFIKLTEFAKTENVLVLEHDWNLIENKDITYDRLKSGLDLMDSDNVDVVRYRHRRDPGSPHYSFKYQGRELDYYDAEIECTSPHLLDCVHWTENPDIKFSDYIYKKLGYYITTARYGNWTNNPCIYKKQFYLDTVKKFAGSGIELEGNISKWWATQSNLVAHGEGLFKHVDLKKYPNLRIF